MVSCRGQDVGPHAHVQFQSASLRWCCLNSRWETIFSVPLNLTKRLPLCGTALIFGPRINSICSFSSLLPSKLRSLGFAMNKRERYNISKAVPLITKGGALRLFARKTLIALGVQGLWLVSFPAAVYLICCNGGGSSYQRSSSGGSGAWDKTHRAFFPWECWCSIDLNLCTNNWIHTTTTLHR